MATDPVRPRAPLPEARVADMPPSMRSVISLFVALLVGCDLPVETLEDGGPVVPVDPVVVPDAGPFVVPDAGQPDGTATRRTCTNTLGNALTAQHGRLDGTLVAIVAPGARTCNGDSDHVHLQVQANGAVYDVAVNVHDNTGGNVFYLARDGAPWPFSWVEGWHPNVPLGYRALGLTAGQFTAFPLTTLAGKITTELAGVNHVSIFATGYGPDGIHNVHFGDGYGYDGAIVIRPLSSNARTLYFHFADQSF